MTDTQTEQASWTVGKAAQAAGLSAKAVRLYEAKGLLPPAERSEAGYRLYTDEDITVLRFIAQAKALGLSLSEIGDILHIRRRGAPPCRHVAALLDERIREIDRTITDLHALRRTLTESRNHAKQYETQPGDDICGVIEHAHTAG